MMRRSMGFILRSTKILSRLPILGGEMSMSVKFPRGNMNGKNHVGESVIG
jgi:hypothetical protein